MKRLADVETPLANFFASGVLALEEKLGPVLWQLPPTLRYDEQRLASFFDLLPRTTNAAAALAAGHDEKVPQDRALTSTRVERPLALRARGPTRELPGPTRDRAARRARHRHGGRGHGGSMAAHRGDDQ